MDLKIPTFTFNKHKTNNCVSIYLNIQRCYSTYSNQYWNYVPTPVHIKMFNNKKMAIFYAELLRNKAGIYYFVNTYKKI